MIFKTLDRIYTQQMCASAQTHHDRLVHMSYSEFLGFDQLWFHAYIIA